MNARRSVVIALFLLIALSLSACATQLLPPDISSQIAEETKVAGYTPTFTPVPTSTYTPTPVPPTETPTPTPTPFVSIPRTMNVRVRPGTNQPILGVVIAGESYRVLGKNPAGTWWLIDFGIRPGWVLGELVEVNGPEAAIVIESLSQLTPTAEP